MSDIKNVIDISKYQGQVDFDSLVNGGIIKDQTTVPVDGIIIRAVSTNKSGMYVDSCFERNITECERLNIPHGVYFISYAKNYDTFKAEFDKTIEALNGRELEYPLVMDIETNSSASVDKETLTSWIISMAEEIRSKGYMPCLYSGLNFSNTHINMSRIYEADIDFWVAAYRSTKPDVPCVMWQYNSEHKVTGISGNCDVNYCYVEYFLDGSTEEAPEETTPTRVVEESKEETRHCSLLDLLRKIFKF